MICKICYVSGKVQGVFFRDSTQRQANLSGINGHAYNMEDGRVEVFMCGTPDQLQAMEDWLWEGSSWSDVTDVKCHTINSAPPQHFTTG